MNQLLKNPIEDLQKRNYHLRQRRRYVQVALSSQCLRIQVHRIFLLDMSRKLFAKKILIQGLNKLAN